MKETQKKPKEKQLLDHDTVSRSNVLIESKSSTSLFERKLLNIAIAKAYVEDGELIAKVSTKDVKNYLHITGNSIYSTERSIKRDIGTCSKYRGRRKRELHHVQCSE